MSDHNDDIELALRRLDRPLRSERSAERRRLMLDEFDASFSRHGGADSDFVLANEPVRPPAERNRLRGLAMVAAAIIFIVALAAVVRPSSNPTEPGSTVPAPPTTVDPVAARVRSFCRQQLPSVAGALQQYADGDLGAGSNVAPLKEAVGGPVETLLTDLGRLGTPVGEIDSLRAELDDLADTYLPIQVTSRVAEIYERLAALLDSGAISGSDTCNTTLLILP